MIRSCSKAVLWLSVLITAYFAFTPFRLPGSEELGDKAMHGGSFFLLFFLSDVGYPRRPAFFALLFLSYGLLIEIVQYFLPLRHFSLYDLLADATGILLYILLRYSVTWTRSRVDSRNNK